MSQLIQPQFDRTTARPLPKPKQKELRYWRNVGFTLTGLGLATFLLSRRISHIKLAPLCGVVALSGLPLIARNQYWLFETPRRWAAERVFNELRDQNLQLNELCQRVSADEWDLFTINDVGVFAMARTEEVEDEESVEDEELLAFCGSFGTGVVKDGFESQQLEVAADILRKRAKGTWYPSQWMMEALRVRKQSDQRDKLVQMLPLEQKRRFFTSEAIRLPLTDYIRIHGEKSLGWVKEARGMQWLRSNLAIIELAREIQDLDRLKEIAQLADAIGTVEDLMLVGRIACPNQQIDTSTLPPLQDQQQPEDSPLVEEPFLSDAARKAAWVLSVDAAVYPPEKFIEEHGQLVLLHPRVNHAKVQERLQIVFALRNNQVGFNDLDEKQRELFSIEDESQWENLCEKAAERKEKGELKSQALHSRANKKDRSPIPNRFKRNKPEVDSSLTE